MLLFFSFFFCIHKVQTTFSVCMSIYIYLYTFILYIYIYSLLLFLYMFVVNNNGIQLIFMYVKKEYSSFDLFCYLILPLRYSSYI